MTNIHLENHTCLVLQVLKQIKTWKQPVNDSHQDRTVGLVCWPPIAWNWCCGKWDAVWLQPLLSLDTPTAPLDLYITTVEPRKREGKCCQKQELRSGRERNGADTEEEKSQWKYNWPWGHSLPWHHEIGLNNTHSSTITHELFSLLKILHIIANIQNLILILTNKCVHDKEKDTSSYTPTLRTHEKLL